LEENSIICNEEETITFPFVSKILFRIPILDVWGEKKQIKKEFLVLLQVLYQLEF
jgi:hypothetical protein